MARTVRMSARSCECAAIGFEHAPPSNDQFRCLIRNVRFRASPSRGKICMCVTDRPSKQAIFVGARSGFIAASAGAIRSTDPGTGRYELATIPGRWFHRLCARRLNTT